MKINTVTLARSANSMIGKGKNLPWERLRDDFIFFKKVTLGNPLIMGRKTAESLGNPLLGRLNIVLSRQNKKALAHLISVGFIIVKTLKAALLEAEKAPGEKICFIGGAEIYTLAIKNVIIHELNITEVDGDFEGTVTCPELFISKYNEISTQRFEKDATRNPHGFTIKQYVLKAA